MMKFKVTQDGNRYWLTADDELHVKVMVFPSGLLSQYAGADFHSVAISSSKSDVFFGHILDSVRHDDGTWTQPKLLWDKGSSLAGMQLGGTEKGDAALKKMAKTKYNQYTFLTGAHLLITLQLDGHTNGHYGADKLKPLVGKTFTL